MADLDDPRRLDRFSNALLDVDPDPILDACVREASRVARAPIALVSLVMRHIQFFRAQVGLPPELAVSRGTSRRSSLCRHVVESDAPVVVNDTARDGRFAVDVTDAYGIRSYVGVPVVLDGATLGSLCVMDGRTREFDEDVVAALVAVAARVSARVAELGLTPPRLTSGSPGPVPAREAVLDMALDATVLERALLEVAPVVLSISRLAPDAFTDQNVARAVDVARQAASVYDDAVEVTHAMHHLLTRVRLEISAEDAGPVAAALRVLERSLTEAGPLVRLVRGAPGLTREELGRAVRVARQAIDFHGEAVDAAEAVRAECVRLSDRAFGAAGAARPN